MGAVESITGADPKGKGGRCARDRQLDWQIRCPALLPQCPLPLASRLRYTPRYEHPKSRRDLGADAVGD